MKSKGQTTAKSDSIEQQKIDIYHRKLDIQQTQDERNYQIAKKAVDANIELAKNERLENRKDFKLVLNYGLAFSLVVMVFIFGSMYLGHTDLIISILKYTALVLIPFLGGKYHERAKQMQDEDMNDHLSQ